MFSSSSRFNTVEVSTMVILVRDCTALWASQQHANSSTENSCISRKAHAWREAFACVHDTYGTSRKKCNTCYLGEHSVYQTALLAPSVFGEFVSKTGSTLREQAYPHHSDGECDGALTRVCTRTATRASATHSLYV